MDASTARAAARGLAHALHCTMLALWLPCLALGAFGCEASIAAQEPKRAPRAPSEMSAPGEHADRSGDTTARSMPDASPCPTDDRAPPGMACVLGGRFARGALEDVSTRPVEAVWVATFWMDRVEVSNAEYRRCVEAGPCKRSMPFRGYGRPEQPAVAMTWNDADAHCKWLGKRLPTEAEWERAARGTDNRLWPWGEGEPSCEHAHVQTSAGRGCGMEVTRAVGTGKPGPFGLYDMAGNVDEWVADWYAPCYRGCEHECGDDCSGIDPRGPCQGKAPCPGRMSRVIRGGSWWWPLDHAQATRRRPVPPSNPPHHRFGFRCARDLG